mmetsp:Transcript_10312/g.15211  ORF Transcript_10312/g.15211 Transcript_10312/m.15211 type:complete len:636 (-) Transcript_10312:87-1994(-)
MATKAPTPFAQPTTKAGPSVNMPADKHLVNKESAFSSGLLSNDLKGLLSGEKPKASKTSADTDKRTDDKSKSPFGGLKGFGDSLSKGMAKSGLSLGSGGQDSPINDKFAAKPSCDFNSLLTIFYEKHNPTKVGEVTRTLEKYKGREAEMFAKLAKKYGVPSPLDAPAETKTSNEPSEPKNDKQAIQFNSSTPAAPNRDYHSVLTKFYEKHNPSKLGEVQRTLEKYRGKEIPMFAKLAQKYNAPNPLDEPTVPKQGLGGQNPFAQTTSSANTVMSSSTAPSPSPFGAPSLLPKSQPQATTPTPFSGGSNAPLSSSPFGAQTPFKSPFGGQAQKSTPSAFGNSAPSPFSSTPAAPFQGSSASFGQPAANISTSSPMGTAPLSGSAQPNAFGGRQPRDILVSFYQQYNPSKIAEVDKLLAKYTGQEEQLFRNLARKYNLDPSMFGISGAAAAAPAASQTSSPSAFGSPSPTRGSTGFGQTSGLGGTFGSGAMSSPSPFGIATSSGFGGTATLGNNTPTTPFGSAGTSSNSGGGTFGSSTNMSTSGGFGALAQGTPTTTSTFGSGFGSSGTGGGFGSVAAAPTASGAFGQASTPGFGSPAPSGFGAFGGGGASSFGSGGTSSFGTSSMAGNTPFGAARR